ncbi:signal transduction histidine kinase [Novosphingobium hassiacum]|uniref:histidine kinase n=1 Tax=Novosphingobium hassiacum TaxID=173676 RepID=A0A7W6A081_9SPHN|nr:ATP-binding protein [Novosphingobium hassiacum]MBB3862736.1 signal transduction histidine kinase [Novosphingobium hassiacum]
MIADNSDRRNLGAQENLPLRKWLWRSYLRSAIIPLLVIEIGFLAVYWGSNIIIYRQNIAELNAVSRDFLTDVARREAETIDTSLSDVSRRTNTFARQTLRAIQGNYNPSAAEKARYGFSPAGVFRTRYDNGTTASFYSNRVPMGPDQIAKVWKLAALDPIMIDFKQSDPAIASIYFNTFDSYNRIYPYIDAAGQYAPNMNIPTYNFYYEADEAHNPARRPVWTDAYIDPAGHGWMVSSIAPVWNGQKLEGVVGIDMTLDTIVNRLNGLRLPWGAYAVLIDRKGGIIAMPSTGERDFGLKELTAHHYAQAILSDTFKPDQFNITKRGDMNALARAMANMPDGFVKLDFANGRHLASFARITGADWRLVVIAPMARIHAKADLLRAKFEMVGVVMLAALFLFYLLFFLFLYRRAHLMSARVAAPLGDFTGLIERIGEGGYRQGFAGSSIAELDDLGHRIVGTGNRLGEAHDRIRAQERALSLALMRQRAANEEQIRFVRIMSHELRTPLSVIDSGAQIIDRKAEALTAAELRKRAGRLRSSVQTISTLLGKLVDSTAIEFSHCDRDRDQTGAIDSSALIRDIARSIIPSSRLTLDLPDQGPPVADGPALPVVLGAVLDNCMRYTVAETPILITLQPDGDLVHITVADNGPGISDEDIAYVGQRFYRGRSSTGVEGAGMGLYIARKLIVSLGGELAIASYETGTIVRLTVPIMLEQIFAA